VAISFKLVLIFLERIFRFSSKLKDAGTGVTGVSVDTPRIKEGSERVSLTP